ncbi:MAG: DUF721 domain-containing protein [Parcubacteria group bacterium]|nr:DUF721 domain-containing protein [Parcubacteria group bacterium]
MDFNIGSYLEKYKHITPPDDFLKKIFITIVKEEINIDIEPKDIRVEHNTIYLAASPAIKSEMHIKKPILLERMREQIEKKQISDIR